MKFNAARFAVMAACVAVAASAHAQTGDWGDLAIVSSTLGNTVNRLCLGTPASMRPADIGCPAYAPFVSATSGFVGIGTVTPTAKLDIQGANNTTLLTATNAIGESKFGIGLQPTGGPILSFTNHNNTATAYIYHTSGRLQIEAASGQNGLRLSGSSGRDDLAILNSGSVGIGTTTPSTTLHVSGSLRISNGGEACDTHRAGAIRYTSSSVFQLCMGSGWQNLADAAGGGQGDRITSGTTNVIAAQDRSVTISTSGTQRVVIGENGKVGVGTASPSSTLHVLGSLALAHPAGTASANSAIQSFQGFAFVGWYGADQAAKLETNSNKDVHLKTTGGVLVIKGTNGNVGIATTTPTATLQVSGSFIVSTSAQTTTPSLYVGTNGNVGIGTGNPSGAFHISGTSNVNQLKVTALPAQGQYSVVFEEAGTGRYLGVTAAANTINSIGNSDFNLSKVTPGYSVLLSTNGLERMRVNPSGNVGIGTTNPTRTLDVSGSANISGTVKVAGTGNEACTVSTLGTIRFNPVTGAPQICVQR